MTGKRNAIPAQIIDEASEWFVVMRERNASIEDRSAFAEWLRASPVHVGAYLEIARLWTDASRIDRSLPIEVTDALPPNVISLTTMGANAATGGGHEKQDASRTARRFSFVGLAATLLIAFVASGAWLYLSRAPTYTTDIGEQRIITLDDGSVVRLNSRSEFRVQMSPRLRRIELVNGQALFDVAHDANRPFIVRSGNSTIRAVGTQFDVDRKQSGITVTVIEGRVRLDPTPPSTLDRLFGAAALEAQAPAQGANDVSAGEQLRVAATGAMQKSAKPNVAAAAISWLRQELVFEDQPLADVVEEFNRYTRTPVVLADPSLGNLRINAVFHTTSPESLLRFISRYDNVRVDRTEDEIRISARTRDDVR